MVLSARDCNDEVTWAWLAWPVPVRFMVGSLVSGALVVVVVDGCLVVVVDVVVVVAGLLVVVVVEVFVVDGVVVLRGLMGGILLTCLVVVWVVLVVVGFLGPKNVPSSL